MFCFQLDVVHARHQNENSARECRTDIAQLPTTWERPALRHKPSQAIAISRIGLWVLEQETEVESAYSAWKADILPLNYSCAKKARQEKKKLALLFTFTTI